jgi:hypothetical protein
MFQSYILKEMTSKNGKNYCWEYELTDSEFRTVFGVHERGIGHWCGVCAAVIQEYDKRNLNVMANLMRAFVWMHKRHPDWSIQDMIDYNKRYNPLFLQYEKDLQKYLVLL